MKVTWNWLSEFVELELGVAEVAERLTMAGLEVEAIERRGEDLESVVCAEVVRVEPHPKADRLRICEVRCGGDQLIRVVCGAPNVAAGQRVAFAPAGTVLPGGMQIAVTEIRGVTSAGMLCSEAELGLGADSSGLLLLAQNAPLGERVARILGAEDTVLEISITPNRGDCLAVLGIAREIAALTGQKLHRQRIAVSESGAAAADLIAISIDDPHLCRRYAGRVIDDIRIGPSPAWLQSRLKAVGMRPINNVVDITNYVMMERGQPLHAFDYHRLPQAEIIVRCARDIRTIETLDGQLRQLDEDDLLITSAGRAVAIAGVMGGANSEVSDNTKRILLESAWFDPSSVRRTSKRLGLRSEASYRFERSTDLEGVTLAGDRAAELMMQLAGGNVRRGSVDVYPNPFQPVPISLRLKRAEDLLGIAVERDQVATRLKAFGMNVSPAPAATLTVIPPSYRSDIAREVDLIEELVRSIGYDDVQATMPRCELGGTGLHPALKMERDIRRFLAGLGLTEAVLLSFCSPEENRLFPGGTKGNAITILNPVIQGDSQMRRSLCPGLVRVARENLNQGNGSFAAFSIGKVFWDDGGFMETKRLAGVICPNLPSRGIGRRGAKADFADLKGVVESIFAYWRIGAVSWVPAPDVAALHPGQSAHVVVGNRRLGHLGLLHPNAAETLGVDADCALFELDLVGVLEYCPARATFEELPRFPVVVRDMAILTDSEFESSRVVEFVRGWEEGQGLIEDVDLFDHYAGEAVPAGKKSLAFTIAYRAADRTLTDAEVNDVHTRLVSALGTSLGVTLR